MRILLILLSMYYSKLLTLYGKRNGDLLKRLKQEDFSNRRQMNHCYKGLIWNHNLPSLCRLVVFKVGK